MEKLPCSIFNDVLGPVMRGPSSSHVAGAARIASLVRQSLLPSKIKRVTCDFDPSGSLAASHTGHGTDMGFACGLMDLDLSNPDVDQYDKLAKDRGLEINYRILNYGAVHPNNYRIEAASEDGTVHRWQAISVGGGMIEMTEYDGFRVSIVGDFYELLVKCSLDGIAETAEKLDRLLSSADFSSQDIQGDVVLLSRKYSAPLEEKLRQSILSLPGVTDAVILTPILPTLSRAGCQVPYRNARELMQYAEKHPMEAWRYAAEYEAVRGNTDVETVLKKADSLFTIMEQAIETGLAGTTYKNRILGPQAYRMDENRQKLVPCSPLADIIRNITAVMETKSAMGLIVAAPTVGSCGCLPGTLIGLGRKIGCSRDRMVKALLTAGLVGVFFAEQATFAAEVAGCQVECGAASGMAAAAVTDLMGGTIEQCMDAASLALQNITGLACDPVANRVEVPCLGKNIMGGSNAIASADMILAGYDAVIPLDETIQAIYQIGLSLPLSLRCTLGGLGETATSKRITEKLKNA